AKISIGSKKDVDKAVAAAKKAFDSYSQMSVDDRIALLTKITEVYQSRYGEIAEAITMEMGAPAKLAQMAQAAMGVAHLGTTI
ncbi:MAG TPA: aldehyde dehydrogenase family protein, partial [Rhodobiaceae bacterium]|nr:aldehyde dehydrogenase family protein [Rhodobiaceae bacterium]